MTGGSWEELAIALAAMSRDLLVQDSSQDTLDRIATHAVQLVEGCEHAGILLVHEGRRVETVAASSELVRASDRVQGELREGPCFDAAVRKQQVYRIADLSVEQQRWPRYAQRARQLGVGSIMGFLLFSEQGEHGALDLYSSQPDVFTERSELVGWLLASHAAVAFSSARTTAQLHTAISTRQEIGEALGIIMERLKITEAQAFERLKRASQNHNIKLREVAQRITETGAIPDDA